MTTNTPDPNDRTRCPTCDAEVYRYNLHACAECGAEVCAFCETKHQADHNAIDSHR